MQRAELSMQTTQAQLKRRSLTAEEVAKQKMARTQLRIIIAVAALALALTVLAQLTGIGAMKTELGSVMSEKPIRILVADTGEVRVTDLDGGRDYLTFSEGRGAFFRSIERAFSLKRRTGDVAADAPYMITTWSTGRMTLNDPATGHQVPIDAFGVSVTETFADLIDRP